MIPNLCHIGLLAVLTTTAVAAPALAQERSQLVAVARSAGVALEAVLKLYDPATGDWATIRHPGPTLAEGDRVAVCAVPRRDGYVSVWSRTLDGARPERVFPNDHTPEARARKGGRVTGGEEICFGDRTEGYGFRVTPPFGGAEVYLHWSPDLNGQFAPEEIPQIPDPGTAPAARSAAAPYSSVTIGYTVSR